MAGERLLRPGRVAARIVEREPRSSRDPLERRPGGAREQRSLWRSRCGAASLHRELCFRRGRQAPARRPRIPGGSTDRRAPCQGATDCSPACARSAALSAMRLARWLRPQKRRSCPRCESAALSGQRSCVCERAASCAGAALLHRRGRSAGRPRAGGLPPPKNSATVSRIERHLPMVQSVLELRLKVDAGLAAFRPPPRKGRGLRHDGPAARTSRCGRGLPLGLAVPFGTTPERLAPSACSPSMPAAAMGGPPTSGWSRSVGPREGPCSRRAEGPRGAGS